MIIMKQLFRKSTSQAKKRNDIFKDLELEIAEELDATKIK